VAARLAWLVDDVAGARRSSTLTLELARTADPATRAAAVQAHALQLTCMGDDPAPVPALLDRADADLADVADAGTRARLAGFGTYVRMVAGDGSAAGALAALHPAGPCSPRQRLELTCSNARLELTVLLGRWSELDAELVAAQALEERGAGPLRSWRSPLAEFHRRFATGDWPGADDLVTELADAPWATYVADDVHVLRTWMALHRGGVAGPADIGPPPGTGGGPRGPDRDIYRVLHTLAGAPGEAPRGYLVMFEWWRLLARVRAAGRDRAALRAVADDLDRIGGPGSAPAALASRARALAAGERGESARHAAQAAAAFEALGMPVDAATARIEGAERGAGRDGLAADLVLLDGLGARPLADRARAVLGRPAATPTRPVLTPREREVAELVTDGLSNAAIADRLVVSVRTVTSHLDHVYTKLGIGSRTELAREIRDTHLRGPGVGT
jgi:DNA-binding CsgD family transcriptional regulator